MADLVRYAIADGVAHLELNRPDAANAFDLPTSQEFGVAVDCAASDPGVRAVLLTGAGARFCAGGDVASFHAAENQSAYLHELALHLDGVLRSLTAMSKPVVCAVQGAVAGAGLGVMLSCDLVVAAPGTRFVFAYPGVGLTPDCGVSYLLPRAIGSHRALGFALSGRPITSQTALEWGLVTEMSDDAVSRARELAVGLSQGPAGAYGQVRRLLRAGWETDRAETGAEEARTISTMVTGAEARTLTARFAAR